MGALWVWGDVNSRPSASSSAPAALERAFRDECFLSDERLATEIRGIYDRGDPDLTWRVLMQTASDELCGTDLSDRRDFVRFVIARIQAEDGEEAAADGGADDDAAEPPEPAAAADPCAPNPISIVHWAVRTCRASDV